MTNNFLKLAPTTRFKKDLKKVAKQQKNKALLNDIIERLQRKELLPKKKS